MSSIYPKMKWRVGDRVTMLNGNPRDVGRIEAIHHSNTARIKWDIGWSSYEDLEDLQLDADFVAETRARKIAQASIK